MEERRVGEDAVEAALGQVELQEVLVEDLAAGVDARHLDEAGGVVEATGSWPIERK